MKQKTLRFVLSALLCFSVTTLNIAPAFALGENLTPPPLPPTEPVTTVVTPPADTTAPAISGVAIASFGLNDATIVWTTNELSISTLEYGTTESLGSSATLPVSALLAHTAILTGLTPNTAYYYCIHATDASGNTANSCGHSFTTAAPVDTTAPTITGITTVAVTSTIVSVAWTTNEPADSQIEYGLTSGYGLSTPPQTTLELVHAATISGLNPDTEYHYRIRTADALGNIAYSNDETFVTPAAAATPGTGITAPILVF